MGQVTLRDQDGHILIQEYFGASANHYVPGLFENNGVVNNAEVNEGLDIMREAANSERYVEMSDFNFSWENLGRTAMPCVRPERLPQGSSVTEQYGVRQMQHVQMVFTEEGSRPGPWGILRETYTTDPQIVPVTIRWERNGHISIFREDLSIPVPDITPPPPPAPPQPDPIAEAFDSAATGVKSFFSDAATRVSQGANSAIESIRSLWA